MDATAEVTLATEDDLLWLVGWHATRRHAVRVDQLGYGRCANNPAICGAGVFSSDEIAREMPWRARLMDRKPPPRCKNCLSRLKMDAIDEVTVAARLVAEERERCARLCEDIMREYRAEAQRLDNGDAGQDEEYWLAVAAQDAAARCVTAIRREA